MGNTLASDDSDSGYLSPFDFDDSDEGNDTSKDNDRDDDNQDDGCDTNRDNSSGSLGEHEECPHYIRDCDAEAFTYEAETGLYSEGHTIRLLRLVSGTGPIQAYLFKAFLHTTGNGTPYEALSYTWGSDEKPKQILLDGKRFMVTENLYSALSHLRFNNRDRILWIDAICINQNLVQERNHQVSHMASIYLDADNVLFWLGESTYETDCLISSLIQLQARASDIPQITQKNARDPGWRTLWKEEAHYQDLLLLQKGLISLLRRPWFKRSWILQEVCFAKTGLLICGQKKVAAYMFALAPWLLGHKPEGHCKAVLSMMSGATRLARYFVSGREMRNLFSLLQRFHRGEAKDPRDQVYALLNMATDRKMANFPKANYENERMKEVIDSVFAYLFPKSWYRRGSSHSYQCLEEFVEDFPHLKQTELEVNKIDTLSMLRLSDDTQPTFLHPQEALRKAIRLRNVQLLTEVLKFSNINLNEQKYEAEGKGDNLPFRPLCEAARLRSANIVKILLDTGKVEVNLKDKDGRTPLSWAAGNGVKKVVQLLLNTGKADVNSKDGKGWTPLWWAAHSKNKSAVKLLLDTGEVDVDAKDAYGLTLLSRVAISRDDVVLKLLLATGKVNTDARSLSMAKNVILKASHFLEAHLEDYEGRMQYATIDLNQLIMNDGGTFAWGGNGFSKSARNTHLRFIGNKILLRANLGTSDSQWLPRELNLCEALVNINGHFQWSF